MLPAFSPNRISVAPRVAKALHRAIEDGDLGYAEPIDLGAAYATFARERYGTETDPADVVAFPEVMVGVAEVLRRISKPRRRRRDQSTRLPAVLCNDS